MRNLIMLWLGTLILVSCHSSPSPSLNAERSTSAPSGIDPDKEREITLRILNKMVQIRGGGEYLVVNDVNLIENETVVVNNIYQLKVVPAHYQLVVKKDFFKKASDIADMSNLTRPPFYSSLDQARLSQSADAAVAYKRGQQVQLEWKLVFKKDDKGDYKRVFPNPENESELLTPDAYEKLLDEHMPGKNEN